jgi:hypothetical protein
MEGVSIRTTTRTTITERRSLDPHAPRRVRHACRKRREIRHTRKAEASMVAAKPGNNTRMTMRTREQAAAGQRCTLARTHFYELLRALDHHDVGELVETILELACHS